MDESKAAVRTSCFSRCKLINEKRDKCIAKLQELQTDYLSPRDIKVVAYPEFNDNLRKILNNTTLTSSTISDADISEESKKAIIEFASENCISIDSSFWNVGNLKKKTPLISPFYGSETSFDGSEEEKHRYDSIQELYWSIEEYQEYKKFFTHIDQQNFVDLVVTNNGNTFDEDIDVKLIIKKGMIFFQKIFQYLV